MDATYGSDSDDLELGLEPEVEVEVEAVPVDSESEMETDEEYKDEEPSDAIEVRAAPVLEKSSILITNPDLMMSSDILTEATLVSVIGSRATDIQNGAPVFIDRRDGMSPIEIAYEEILKKRSPMAVILKVGTNAFGVVIEEKRSINDMGLPSKSQ